MIVGPAMLTHLIKVHGLVYPEPAKEVTGDSVDLRIKRIMKHTGGAVLREENPYLGDPEDLEPEGGAWILEPGKYYLARTAEQVHLPPFLAATGMTRLTMVCSGLVITVGYIDPCYSGYIHFGITTPEPKPTEIEVGFPILQLVFHLAEVARPYDGSSQGGQTGPK